MATTNSSGDTPLHAAARHGHVHVSCLLLDHGADILHRNHVGQTPLAVADSVSTAKALRLHQRIVADRSLQALLLLLTDDKSKNCDCGVVVVDDDLLSAVHENIDHEKRDQTTPISCTTASGRNDDDGNDNDDDTCCTTKASTAATATSSHQSRGVMSVLPDASATMSSSSSRDILVLEKQDSTEHRGNEDSMDEDGEGNAVDEDKSSSNRNCLKVTTAGNQQRDPRVALSTR
jgi:ankyrin repeat protein